MSAVSAQSMTESKQALRSGIQKVATGPEYSKNLNFDEAHAAMSEILSESMDPVQAAIFLIALRMKREVDDENKGVLQAILDTAQIVTADVDEVLDIADPYDGHTRGLPMASFIAPVMASLGVPAVCHGVEAMGPKYGITHYKILKAAGKSVDLDVNSAAARLSSTGCGWAYVDQRAFAPRLHDLQDLRTRMVKRQVLTTVEVLVGPVRGKNKTHLLTGYVHKAYPAVYAELARFANFNSAIIVRGVEGGVIPSLQQPAKLFSFHDKSEERPGEIKPGEIKMEQITPQELGIEQTTRAVPLPKDLPPTVNKADNIAREFDVDAAAQKAAELGLEALNGKPGPALDAMIYSAAICLKHLGHANDFTSAAKLARDAITSGKALAHFKAG